MKIHFTEDGWEDYQHWVENNQDMLARVNVLIEDARRRLFAGLGKPEPLKGALAGWWSRRIIGEHRLLYRIAGMASVDRRIEIIACRFYYGDG